MTSLLRIRIVHNNPPQVGNKKRNKPAAEEEDGVVVDLVCDKCTDIVEQLV